MPADWVTPRAVLITWMLAAFAFTACQSTGIGTRTDRDAALKAAAQRAETGEIAALPEGAGKALVTERCLLCHSAGLIAQQRKDAAAWTRTVAQMRTWGTPIQDEDQTAIVAYLAEHFGPGAGRR
jgi:cytochrome c5